VTVSAAPRVLIVACLIAGLAWLCIAAGQTGMAGSTVYRTVQEMSTWSASGAEPGQETVAWLADDLEHAAARDAGDPNIQELLGALWLHRIDRPEFLDEALVHYKRAVELRPTSPYAWADVASTEYRKGDTGREFQAALRRAAELGPAEPEVQRTVADFGLATWDEATPETRRAVEAMVTGAMKRDPAEILQVAGRRGRLGVACRHLADAPRRVDPQWRLICERREATS
jgi:cytochrome c-type biogenesis protein CcmH/NrfG